MKNQIALFCGDSSKSVEPLFALFAQEDQFEVVLAITESGRSPLHSIFENYSSIESFSCNEPIKYSNKYGINKLDTRCFEDMLVGEYAIDYILFLDFALVIPAEISKHFIGRMISNTAGMISLDSGKPGFEPSIQVGSKNTGGAKEILKKERGRYSTHAKKIYDELCKLPAKEESKQLAKI